MVLFCTAKCHHNFWRALFLQFVFFFLIIFLALIQFYHNVYLICFLLRCLMPCLSTSIAFFSRENVQNQVNGIYFRLITETSSFAAGNIYVISLMQGVGTGKTAKLSTEMFNAEGRLVSTKLSSQRVQVEVMVRSQFEFLVRS